jgi:hypothetical protein
MKLKMATMAGLSLKLDPIGKNVSKRFFSETTCIIETRLPRKDPRVVLSKMFVFYADRKSKMATTAGHRLTLDPVEDHPTNIHVQFGFNHIYSF